MDLHEHGGQLDRPGERRDASRDRRHAGAGKIQREPPPRHQQHGDVCGAEHRFSANHSNYDGNAALGGRFILADGDCPGRLDRFSVFRPKRDNDGVDIESTIPRIAILSSFPPLSSLQYFTISVKQLQSDLLVFVILWNYLVIFGADCI